MVFTESTRQRKQYLTPLAWKLRSDELFSRYYFWKQRGFRCSISAYVFGLGRRFETCKLQLVIKFVFSNNFFTTWFRNIDAKNAKLFQIIQKFQREPNLWPICHYIATKRRRVLTHSVFFHHTNFEDFKMENF